MKSSFLRTLIHTITGLILLLLLIAIPSAPLLLRNPDFKKMVKLQIETALSSENLQVHIGDLSFRPFYHLTAENVVLNSRQKDKPQIGNIDRVTLSLNLLGFLPWQRFVKAIHLHNASVNVPLSDDPKHFFPLRKADARIILEPNRVKIFQAHFVFEKMRFLVRGEVFNPHLLGTLSKPTEQKKVYLRRLARLIEELGKVQYLKEPPKADIVFEADLSQPHAIQVLNIDFHAKDSRYQDILVHQLQLYANYIKGALEIHQLRVEDQTGSLTASGTVDFDTSKGHLILQSSINPTKYLAEFAPRWRKIRRLRNLRMETPPKIDINTDFSWKDRRLLCNGNGSAILQSFSYKDVFFPLLELKLSAKNDALKVRQLTLQDTQGKLTASGSANLTASKGHFTLNSSLNPFPILKAFLPNCKAQYLRGIHIESPPQIYLDGDLSWENKELDYSGTGTASLYSFSYNQQFFPELDLKFSAKDSVISVEWLRLQDAKGEFTASGKVDLHASKSNLTLQSSINLFPLVRQFISDPKLEVLWNLQSESPPKLDLTAKLSWKGEKLQYQGSGSASLQSFSYKNQFFPQLDFKFAAKNEQTSIRNFHLQTRSGTLKGDVLLAPNKFQIEAESTANPKEFIDFYDPGLRAFFNASKIIESPHLSLRLSGSDLASLRGSGELTLGRMAVRGAWIDFGHTKFEVNAQALTCQNFSVGRGKGRGSGTVIYDFKQQHIYLRDIDSTMVPVDVMQWIEPHIAKVIAVYRFHAPPRVRLQGVVSLIHPDYNALSIHIDSQAGLDYDLIRKTLRFGTTSAEVHIDGPWVKVRIPSAEIFRGSAAVTANVSLDPKNPIFNVDVTLARVDFAHLTKLYFNYDDSKGFLSGNYQFHARLGKETDMIGSGHCSIEGGTVLSVPFLGPISLIMNQILPEVGNAPAKNATADFQVRNRKIMTNDLEISGTGFVLQGHGDIAFLTGKMDMIVRIKARGLPGLLFFPISRLFEYESRGTIMNPEWHLKSPFKPRLGVTE